MRQKIVPHIWFDKEAKEAAEFYASLFPDSRIINVTTLHDTPSGDVDVVSFELAGYEFMAISAGPDFKINPSISFMINFDPSKDENARDNLDKLWEKLSDGGEIAMPLDKYPFSERYGWIQDKYGVSWQLILTDPDGEERPFIIPSLLFVTDECEAAEATDFYLSVFKNAPSASSGETKRGIMARYPAGMEPSKEGAVMFTDFQLAGQWFSATDGSAKMHNFNFNEAVSLVVNCKDQEDVDYYWEKLSAVPEAEQCGWLKDKYGVSWQIVPEIMKEIMTDPNKEASARATKSFLKMKKLNIQELKKAYEE